MANIVARYLYGNNNCNTYDNNGYCRSSAWSNWARWLVLGLIIAGAILIFFLFSCITSRRRRKMGYSPYRGTGWALGRTPPGHAPATYNAPQQEQQQPYYNNSNNPAPYYNNSNTAAPPPVYQPPANREYYGGNNDVENQVQQPQPTYGGIHSGPGEYQPPPGPPPAKHY